jgi:hypothetical protein
MRPRGQSGALFGRQQDRGCGSHASEDVGYVAYISQVICDSLH